MQEDILDKIEFFRECLNKGINEDLTNLHDNEVVELNHRLNDIIALYIQLEQDKDT
jgi:hypothetical protein